MNEESANETTHTSESKILPCFLTAITKKFTNIRLILRRNTELDQIHTNIHTKKKKSPDGYVWNNNVFKYLSIHINEQYFFCSVEKIKDYFF